MTLTQIPSTVFTSAIPDVLIGTAASRVSVRLATGGDTIFATQLYAYEGQARLSDPGSIVEDEMRARECAYLPVTLTVTAEGEEDVTATFTAVFCECEVPEEAETWLTSHYLTTLASRTTYKGCSEVLRIYSAVSVVPMFRIMLRSGNEVRPMDARGVPHVPLGTRVLAINCGYNDVLTLLAQQSPTPRFDEVVAWTVTVGNRVAAYYLTDEAPDISLRFTNCFGVEEFAHLCATSVTKTSQSHGDAVVSGKTRYYDFALEQTHEVTTAALANDYAAWLTEMLVSRKVFLWYRAIPVSANWPRVLISEHESNLGDGDDEPNKLTFSWRYVDSRVRIAPERVPNEVFNDVFDHTFD